MEDSPTQAEHLRQLLEAGGYAVKVAATGKQALALARRDPPALILSDIVMPEMDGYELCQAIKSDNTLKDIPVVLVTELSGAHDVVRALECGADSFVRKPYDEQYLLARLGYIEANQVLRKHENTQMGLEIDVAGHRHFITAERRQILDLLISTYEEAVRVTEELRARQETVERSNQLLSVLYRIAKELNQATSEQQVIQNALDRALELPAVRAGWVSLREGEAGFRLAAASHLPPALARPGAMEGDCLCRRMLLSGDLRKVTNVLECERLQRAQGDTRGLRSHASIPLWVGDRVRGVMNLAGPGPGLFSDEDLKTLNGIGNQIAIALERAWLLEHLEAEVKTRTAALTAETAAREQVRAHLSVILERTSDLVGLSDPQGRVLYINPAGRSLLGLSAAEDVTTMSVFEFEPTRMHAFLREEVIPAVIRDGVWEGELTLRARDGQEIAVLAAAASHPSADGSVVGLSIIARDLTERKRAEEALRQTEKLAALGELLAGVAHELNNPLAVVVGQAVLLRQAVEGGPVAGRAEKIARAADRCARIVKNFLALARRYPADRQPTSLNPVLQEAVELLAYQLRVDSVEVQLDLAQDLPLLWADPHQLHQVVVNLVTNAHHAMRGAPPPRRLTLVTRADPTRTRVSLEVADTGGGIPPEIRGRIFEPFFTTKLPGEGTGLGLSLCSGIVGQHGGSIRVESEPGHGATFFVDLPVEVPPARGWEAVAAPAELRISGKTILVVDDEPEVAGVLAEMLAADGHQVETAANGALALDRLREQAYDLILCDVRMPELDGPGLYREVERRHPALVRRFVFLTGDTLSPETMQVIERTGVLSLSKPFRVEEIRRAVQRALRAG